MDADRERMYREVIGELLDRGDFDPFLPFASVQALAIRRPIRTLGEQQRWEARLAVFAGLVYCATPGCLHLVSEDGPEDCILHTADLAPTTLTTKDET